MATLQVVEWSQGVHYLLDTDDNGKQSVCGWDCVPVGIDPQNCTVIDDIPAVRYYSDFDTYGPASFGSAWEAICKFAEAYGIKLPGYVTGMDA